MTAEEARKIATKFNTDSINSQYREIINEIKEKCSLGCYHLYYFKTIDDFVISKLKQDGFLVTNEVYRYNEISIKISWRNN